MRRKVEDRGAHTKRQRESHHWTVVVRPGSRTERIFFLKKAESRERTVE